MARIKSGEMALPGYPERLKINADDGYSTYDPYLSKQTPEIWPEGGVLQDKCIAQSYNECSIEEQIRRRQWSPNYAADSAFDNQEGPGGSTFAFPKRR